MIMKMMMMIMKEKNANIGFKIIKLFLVEIK